MSQSSSPFRYTVRWDFQQGYELYNQRTGTSHSSFRNGKPKQQPFKHAGYQNFTQSLRTKTIIRSPKKKIKRIPGSLVNLAILNRLLENEGKGTVDASAMFKHDRKPRIGSQGTVLVELAPIRIKQQTSDPKKEQFFRANTIRRRTLLRDQEEKYMSEQSEQCQRIYHPHIV